MTTSSNSSFISPEPNLWYVGRSLSEATDAFVAEFTASVQFDQRFYKQDIAGSIAHATMLAKVGYSLRLNVMTLFKV
jgi:argininosuccinate lyase